MSDRTYNVLFVCTGNSARSILAEGLMQALGSGRFNAYSAGSHPKGYVEPLALATLEQLGVPVMQFRSKSWDEFAVPGSPALDFVFTVCDKAAGEMCPVGPGQPVTAHWGLPDPAAIDGDAQRKTKAYMDAAMTLKRRIELLLALPITKLEGLSLQQAVDGIGRADV